MLQGNVRLILTVFTRLPLNHNIIFQSVNLEILFIWQQITPIVLNITDYVRSSQTLKKNNTVYQFIKRNFNLPFLKKKNMQLKGNNFFTIESTMHENLFLILKRWVDFCV